ncbi:hypothetical protein [Cerasicoccus fimbriatus]|uniref:hypothetical protein n=1 Tax=Cerasicoccus fimbriatus TaxID=3014554 RepID=UPI0022B58A93|nr:hypothetical protein [Cerasicoccus sp. TK19100]
MKSFKKYQALALAFGTASFASATVIVEDWQFNTPGDNEGWTANAFTVANLHVGPAVSGSETVLTSDNLQNQADPKIFFPNEVIALPVGSTGWDQLVIRIRQIGDDGVTPVAFNNVGSFAMLGTTPWGTLEFIDGDTGDGDLVPVTQVTESDEWNIFTYDLSEYTSGSISGGPRLDPIQGNDIGGGVIQGNFEIDYVTLTANSIPEPGQTSLLIGAALLGWMAYRRRM